jgi:dUTP pyrophosphatase
VPEAAVAVTRLPHGAGLPLPAYGSAGAAPVELAPGGRMAIPTGLAVALPAGHELQVRPRSGLALKNGILVANSPGTVDEDYRGEIKIILLNAGTEPFRIERGMRIAQGVLAPVTRIRWQEVASLDETVRGMGGFGSTGV